MSHSPTISLCVITKNGCPDLEEYFHYFDEVLIQVNGKDKTYVPPEVENTKIKLTEFTWTEDFAEARNVLLKEVTTDYWMWLDDDDTVTGMDKLRELLSIMEEKQLDGMFLPYEYQRNGDGELEAFQGRERILRTKHPFKWRGAIHETPISESQPSLSSNDEMVVKHRPKTIEQIEASAKRNHKILLREYNRKDKDPRIIYYLARSYMWFHEDEKAIKCYLDYIKVSGWEEEKCRAWCEIAMIHLRNSNYDKSISAGMAALRIDPTWVEAYWTIVQSYYGMDQPNKVVHWLETGLRIPEPDTQSITSPNKRVYAMVTGCFALMSLGRVKEAYELFQLALETSPKNSYALKNKPLIEYSYWETLAIEDIEYLCEFYEKAGGDPLKLIQTIPASFVSDPRLNPVRQRYMPAQTWGDKSITFFCPPSGQVWGADTLSEGMGGSEEAVVYLSRELAKQGWEVTIFNERDEEYVDMIEHGTDFKEGELQEVETKVTYKPWTLMNPSDEYNILIGWRAPELIKNLKAKFKGVDVHDAIQHERVEEASKYIDKFFVKSRYHRSLYDQVPDDKFAVISNGIVGNHFHG